jgi:UDP-N-acetylglucosamine acyltransferase
MAGHVTIDDWAIISGLVAMHQFVASAGTPSSAGLSRISQDVAPFCRVSGNPPKIYGLNTVGLERRGFPPSPGPPSRRRTACSSSPN